MDAQDLGLKLERIRKVMIRAYDRGYRGPGRLWAFDVDPELPQIVARGEHVEVLKSVEFVQRFFTPKAAITGSVGRPLPPTGIPATRIEGDLLQRLREELQRVQSLGDPLDYLWENL